MARFSPGARIGQVHGTYRPADAGSGAPNALAYAMYHPAAALHQGSLNEALFRDMLGVPATTNSISELARSEVIVVDGVDLARQLPTIGGAVLRAKLAGAKLVVIDSRRHRVAESADFFLQLKPGTEPVLYGAMAKVIVDRGLMNLPFIKAHCRGYEEFLARVRALLRRTTPSRSHIFHLGDIILDTRASEVEYRGEKTKLLKKELDILVFLIKHPGQSFTGEDLLNRIWSSDSIVTTETVRTHIKNLRRKLELLGAEDLIKHVRGHGYGVDSSICSKVSDYDSHSSSFLPQA